MIDCLSKEGGELVINNNYPLRLLTAITLSDTSIHPDTLFALFQSTEITRS